MTTKNEDDISSLSGKNCFIAIPRLPFEDERETERAFSCMFKAHHDERRLFTISFPAFLLALLARDAEKIAPRYESAKDSLIIYPQAVCCRMPFQGRVTVGLGRRSPASES